MRRYPRMKPQLCPVAADLIRNAPSLEILRFPAFAAAISKAVTDLTRVYR